MNKPVKFLEIGKIVKPRGLKGEMKAVSYLSGEGLPADVTEVYLDRQSGERQGFTLADIRRRGKVLWIRLEGVNTIAQAENLVGSRILVPRDRWGSLAEGEYFWQDLLGLTVVTEEGQTLGTISGIVPVGDNDIYICRGGEREILLPAVGSVVRTVDLDQGTMVVRLPEGLDEAS